MVMTWPMTSRYVEPAAASRQNAELTRALSRERSRLWHYIRRRVDDDADAEDVLQDVFGEMLEAYRALIPIERLGAWLMRVARNRLIDRMRARRPESALPERAPSLDEADTRGGSWEELLPDPNAGPDAAYARGVLLDELQAALEELPAPQREAFVAHELEGESFAAMAARTGVGLSTLLARKHYAVLYLRRRLGALRDEFVD